MPKTKRKEAQIKEGQSKKKLQANQANCPHTALLFRELWPASAAFRDAHDADAGAMSRWPGPEQGSSLWSAVRGLWTGDRGSHSITISSVTLKISLEAREKSPDD